MTNVQNDNIAPMISCGSPVVRGKRLRTPIAMNLGVLIEDVSTCSFLFPKLIGLL